ncbi:uncharacterized protein LOC133203501 [Saccostrea echinata]|uniref:uncharacterized protein LOC133203501 n=1 Tax=Saccostrea echinata TaxID=191078 RepID=UPI002A81C031|nr:uncharacterized protein LOC133203501 [Saccostrea echinata]
MLKWRKEENTRYQDNVENETRTQSTNDETDKYTTIQDAQVRAKSNVYRDTIHDINTKPLPRTPHRHSASNGRIPNAQNDSLYNDGAFEIDINAQEEYQDPFPESKWPKNCHINLLKRAKSVTSKEETSGIPSYVTIIGEGESSDFKVVHKCSSCQKKSLFKIKELENEIEEVQQLAPEETVRESPYFMSEQTEDSDIHNYKKMNEAVSEL